jgi:hypothetical protein
VVLLVLLLLLLVLLVLLLLLLLQAHIRVTGQALPRFNQPLDRRPLAPAQHMTAILPLLLSSAAAAAGAHSCLLTRPLT